VYQNFVIPYLYEDQHVSGETPPIIRSLKLHWQPLVFHIAKTRTAPRTSNWCSHFYRVRYGLGDPDFDFRQQ
jgi:hypothetical protein